MQGVLNLWRMRNLTLEGRIVVFKMLAISKIVFVALLTKIPYQVVKELEKIQNSFLWKDSAPKIRHETTLKKLSSNELYSILITKYTNKASSNVYFEKVFPNMKLDWRNIYILPRIITVNTYLRSFQYKILNNIVFLNKNLFVFWKKNTPLCLFCNNEEETSLHIFSECTYVIYIWQQLPKFFEKNLILAALTAPCLGSGMTTQITMNPLQTIFY